MNGKACAGTGEQGHLIIFTCARNARTKYAHGKRMKKEERKNGKKKKNGNCRRKKMAGRKRLPENRDSKKDSGEIYHKQRRGIVGKGDLL